MILIMIKYKKKNSVSKIYSKTQLDETISSTSAYYQEQEAQNKLHQLSIFNSQFVVSNHLTHWMKYHTDSLSPYKQAYICEQGFHSELQINDNKSNETTTKTNNLNFVTKKIYERDNQFKKTIKEAVKESKRKKSCTAFNLSLPLSKTKNHQRIHSVSMRIDLGEDQKNEPLADFSQTAALFHPAQPSQQTKVLRTTFLHKKSQRKQCILLIRKKKQKFVRCVQKADNSIIATKSPYKNFMATLTNLITVEKQKVVIPEKNYQCHSQFKGKVRKDRFSTMN